MKGSPDKKFNWTFLGVYVFWWGMSGIWQVSNAVQSKNNWRSLSSSREPEVLLPLFFFFPSRFIFLFTRLFKKGRFTKRRREKRSSGHWFIPKWLQWLEMSWSKARSLWREHAKEISNLQVDKSFKRGQENGKDKIHISRSICKEKLNLAHALVKKDQWQQQQ